MRGEDRTSGTLFSFVDVEARIAANHPLRAMRRLTNVALTELDARFSALYEGIGRPSIPPERLLRAVLFAASLFDPLGAATGRTAGVRHAVSLVRRAVDRRKGFRRLDFLQEPRPLSHARDRARVSVFHSRPAGGEGASERRAFFGRWNAAESLGVDEELPSEERLGRRPGDRPRRGASAGAQRRGRLPQDQAVERDARLDDGQGRAPLPQRRRAGEPPSLSGPRLDGEPQRARGGGRGDAGDRNSRTRGGGGFQPALAQGGDPRRRQGLCRRGLRRGAEGARDRGP